MSDRKQKTFTGHVKADEKKHGEGHGNWGNPQDQEGPGALDKNDPNYVDDEDKK